MKQRLKTHTVLDDEIVECSIVFAPTRTIHEVTSPDLLYFNSRRVLCNAFSSLKNRRSQKTFSNQQCQKLVKEIIAPPALEIDALGMRTKNELVIIIPRKPDVF